MTDHAETAGPERRIVVVVCTDRGQHASRLLAELVDRRRDDELSLPKELGEDWHRFELTGRQPRRRAAGRAYAGFRVGGAFRRHTWDLGRVPGRDRSALARGDVVGADEPPGWELGCPTCRRDLRLREELLGRAVDALRTVAAEPDRVRLDISRLPF